MPGPVPKHSSERRRRNKTNTTSSRRGGKRTGAEAVAMSNDLAYDIVLVDPTLSGASEPLVPLLLAQRPELASRLVLLGDEGRTLHADLPEIPHLAKPLVPRDARAVLQRLLG